MDILFYRNNLEEPIALDVAPTEIRPADQGFTLPSPASPGEEVAYTRPFANGQHNGRLPVALPDGLWEVADTMSLNEAFPVQEVLYADGNVVVQQEKFWELFDRNGTSLGQGSRDWGDITLDPDHGRFYTSHHSGFIKAWDLATGNATFLFLPMFGSGYDRSVVQTEGNRVWLVGTELPAMSRQGRRLPEYTGLEVQTLGDTLQTDEENVLRSNRRLETLMTRPEPMLTATAGQGLVLAAPGHIFLVDEALQVTADLQGNFTPLALSLDEDGRAYLAVRVPDEQDEESPVGGLDGQNDGPRTLWGITPEGERFINARLLERAGEIAAPPLVGYDHTTYVLLGKRVVAVSPTGDIRWRHRVGTHIEGAVVTADNKVIVTAGSRVLALTSEGERQFLWEAPEEPLRTSPVLVSPTRLYVASSSTLYRLAPLE